jgi:endoglucanase
VAPVPATERAAAAGSAVLTRLLSVPQAVWFTGGTPSSTTAGVRALVRAAWATSAVPVLVAYNIPMRDCGSHSAGGEPDADAYAAWIRALARGIADLPAVVVLEPDAVASAGCLSSARQRARFAMLSSAVLRLERGARTAVYLDGGNARWIDARIMAARMAAAGIAGAHGFAVNVANFGPTSAEIAYARRLSQLVGGKPFVIDTSRNGAGAATGSEWCNPKGAALGVAPETSTGVPGLDALLWIKHPGRSDGECGRGEPQAGTFWPAYATRLATAAGWS